MNEANDDRIESQLRQLRPAPVSPDLYARIERGGAAQRIQQRKLAARLLLTLAAGIVLAVGAAVIVVMRFRPHAERVPTPVVIAPPPESPTVPLLWSYQLAAMRSPEDLDALLKRDAKQLLQPTSDETTATIRPMPSKHE